VAKKIQNNFTKFIKLASAVKKIADKDRDVLDYIIANTEKKSGSNWNIIQRWTSANLFPDFKEKPLSELTAINIENAINSETKTASEGCASVFKVPNGDIAETDPFDLEQTLMSLDPNLKVQVKLNEFDTGIVKVKDLPIGNGELTNLIRGLYPDIEEVVSDRLRIKGRKNNYKNCNYFIKFFFENDELTQEEESRVVIKKVTLTTEEEEALKLRKKEAKDSRGRRVKNVDDKSKIRKTKVPKKTTSKTEDENFPTNNAESTKSSKAETLEIEKQKTLRFKEFNIAREQLTSEFKEGIWTKKEFKAEVLALRSKLEKGGVI